MRKMIKKTSIWTMALLLVLLFSCDQDPDPVRNYIGANDLTSGMDMNSISGQWTAIKAVWKDELNTMDVSKYFNCFQLTLEQGMAICCINGDETWRSVKEWDDQYTIFENIKDRNTMDFNIKRSGTGASGDDLVIIIQKAAPGFNFLPEKVNTGIYIITLIR